MKRFIADFLLCLLGIAVIGLFGCSAPQPLGPSVPDSTEVTRDCITEDGKWYDCDHPTFPPSIPEDA